MLAIRKMILRRLLSDLLAQRGNIVIDSERGFDPEAKTFYTKADLGKAVDYALGYDEVHIFQNPNKSFNQRDGYGPFVYVIFGNGNCDLDMISDYSTSLSPVLDPISKWIEDVSEGRVELVTK